MNVSCNSSVSGNVHVDVLFQYAMIIVVLLLYIDETKIKIINYIEYSKGIQISSTKKTCVTTVYVNIPTKQILRNNAYY